MKNEKSNKQLLMKRLMEKRNKIISKIVINNEKEI